MAKADKTSEHYDKLTNRLMRFAQKNNDELFLALKSSFKGLSQKEVSERLKLFDENRATENKEISFPQLLLKAIHNPSNYLILSLATVSYFSGNIKACILMMIIVFFSFFMTMFQEFKFSRLVKKLLRINQENIHVIRKFENEYGQLEFREKELIPINNLVPGDIVQLRAGNFIPADIRLLSSHNLIINQSMLTGESGSVEKNSSFDDGAFKSITDLKNICFLGSQVDSGSGVGIVVNTGKDTYIHSLVSSTDKENETNFDKGIRFFVWRSIRYMVLSIIAVFLINFLVSKNWSHAFLLAITLGLSLTPMSLPLTVSNNLIKAALLMLKKKVIIKRLRTMQNLGSMDVLCIDKTGTITEELFVFGNAYDQYHKSNHQVLFCAFLNSFFRKGIKITIDSTIINYYQSIYGTSFCKDYTYLDEIPYDHERKRATILLKTTEGKNILICAGAIEALLPLCSMEDGEEKESKLRFDKNAPYISMSQKINELGLKTLAVAYKEVSLEKNKCKISDEENLILKGYITFLDPPLRQDTKKFISELREYGVSVKILTGDNHWDSIKIAKEIGVTSEKVLLGSQLDTMEDKDLLACVDRVTIFAKLSPDHKKRVIVALKEKNHVVGFVGDGINDVPAIRAADIGISVDSALPTVKEYSDIILLEKSLLPIIHGIIEGRRAFGFISRYIRYSLIGKSGTAFSIFGASLLLPFSPMQPIQMLVHHLLFDISQLGNILDKIDEEYLKKSHRWQSIEIQRSRFVYGSILTLFDFLTFGVMWYFFVPQPSSNQTLFQTGWFLESLILQTLITYIFRSEKIPFIQIKFPIAMIALTMFVIAVAIYLPFSAFNRLIGLAPLPASYFVWICFVTLAYLILAQIVKLWMYYRESEIKSLQK